jgi:hypothetical protein
MSDDYNDTAIMAHAEDLVERARDDADFCAGVLLAAAHMLAFPANRSEISANIKHFSAEVWNIAADALAGTRAANALLDRVRRAEGSTDV